MTSVSLIKKRLRDLYWWWKDRHVVEKICDNPETYLVYVPRDTDKVGVDVYVRSGISIEDNETFGVGHLLEHYLSETISRAHQADFYINGRINHEMINIYARLDRDRPRVLVKSFLDKVFNVKFGDQVMLDYEKLAIQNELNTDSQTLNRRIERIVEAGRFEGECRCIKSFEDTVAPTANLNLGDVEGHYAKIFNRQNVKVFISVYSPAPVFKKFLRKILPTFALPEGKRSEYPSCNYSVQKIERIPSADVAGTYIYLTMPALCSTESDKDKIVMRMVLDLLTGREDGYSISKVARLEGFYSVSTYWMRMEKIGFVSIYSYVPKEKISKLLEVIGTGLRSLKEKPVSTAYLRREIRDLGNIYRKEWRSNERTTWVIEEIVDRGRYESLRYYLKVLKSITPDDLTRIAGQVFDTSRANLYFYGEQPEESNEDLLAKIK